MVIYKYRVGRINADGIITFAMGILGNSSLWLRREYVIVAWNRRGGSMTGWVVQTIRTGKSAESTLPATGSPARRRAGVSTLPNAEALAEIRENHPDHSLMSSARQGHPRASSPTTARPTTWHVTKSVMTTLIGIAADQGKPDLDDPRFHSSRREIATATRARKDHRPAPCR